MTIQEAIKSGRRFSRQNGDYWFRPGQPERKFTEEDILSNDWIIDKRSPREIFVNLYATGHGAFAYQTAAEARSGASSDAERVAVKFREVIDE